MRVLFLGIQILNTTVKELSADIRNKRLDDCEMLNGFLPFLDTLAPLLENRVHYLSIGNESEICLSLNPDELDQLRVFLKPTEMILVGEALFLITS